MGGGTGGEVVDMKWRGACEGHGKNGREKHCVTECLSHVGGREGGRRWGGRERSMNG